jgi:hypothetical protein
MHQAEMSDGFVLINGHLSIQKYKVHLDECEDHSGCRCDGHQNVMAMAGDVEFEILREFQSRVDHGTDAESHGADPQVKRSVMVRCPKHFVAERSGTYADVMVVFVRTFVVFQIDVFGGAT